MKANLYKHSLISCLKLNKCSLKHALISSFKEDISLFFVKQFLNDFCILNKDKFFKKNFSTNNLLKEFIFFDSYKNNNSTFFIRLSGINNNLFPLIFYINNYGYYIADGYHRLINAHMKNQCIDILLIEENDIPGINFVFSGWYKSIKFRNSTPRDIPFTYKY